MTVSERPAVVHQGSAAAEWLRGATASARAADRAAPFVAVGLGVGFFLLWTGLLIAQYDAYHIYYRDFAIQVNTLWNTAQGRPFDTTLLLKNTNHLAEHVAPIMLLLAPIFRVLPDPRVLIVVQQAALALAGIPVYLLARRMLGGPWTPVLVLAGYFLAPNLAQVNVARGFYPVAVSAAPIAFGAYFTLTGRPKRGAAIALAALLVEETSALALLGLGGMLIVRRQARLGLLVAGVAAAWVALLALLVMPSYHLESTLPETGNRTLHKYRQIRDDPSQLLIEIVERGPEAARWLLVPTAGLPLLAPFTLIASLPTIAALLFQYDDSLQTHRVAPAIPLLWLAMVDGLRRVRGNWKSRLALGLLMVCSLASYAIESPLPGGGQYDPSLSRWDRVSDAMTRATAMVPPDASVAGTSNTISHLSTRERIYAFPGKYSEGLWPEPRIDWFVIDVSQEQLRRDFLSDERSPLRTKRTYALWLMDDEVLIATDFPRALAHPASGQFGDSLRLEGFEVQREPNGVRLCLGWRVLEEPSRDYGRQVELVNAEGVPLASQEGPATLEYHPTSKWRAGQLVVEEFSVPLESEVSLAKTHLRLRWSEVETGRRLETIDDANYLDLAVPAP